MPLLSGDAHVVAGADAATQSVCGRVDLRSSRMGVAQQCNPQDLRLAFG